MTYIGRIVIYIIAIFLFWPLTSCSVNPFNNNNEFTGTATGTLIGAGAGAGAAGLLGASKTEMGLAGLAGGALGYYFTSLPFRSGGITHVGGQVFTLGDYVTIEIPSNSLFDVNSSDFTPQAPAILDSAVAVLNRYPNDNIMISGNTSGFYTSKFERKISEDRARQVSAYLWAHGIGNDNFNNPNDNYGGPNYPKRFTRNLTYVGYGSHFPIASDLTAQGIRQNNRIQITAFPHTSEIKMYKCVQCAPSKDNFKTYKDMPPANKTTVTKTTETTEVLVTDKNVSWEEYEAKHPSTGPSSSTRMGNVGGYKD